MTYDILPVVPDDASALLAYTRQVGSETDNLLLDENGIGLTAEEERAFLERIASSERNIMLKAVAGAQIVGLVSLQTYGSKRIAHRASIGTSVRKDYWGQGIGRALMNAVIAHAEKVGVEVLELTVRSDNARAKSLYESLGFKAFGVHPRFMKIRGNYYDCIAMTLMLPDKN